MRPLLAVGVILSFLGCTATALAEGEGPLWRPTTPRAEVVRLGDLFTLRVPDERAWGIASSALPITPGRAYRARVALEAHDPAVRGTFLRIALYARADGRARQRRWYDTPLLADENAARELRFVAPRWARSAKLRVLVRASDGMTQPVRATEPVLAEVVFPPLVVLRLDD